MTCQPPYSSRHSRGKIKFIDIKNGIFQYCKLESRLVSWVNSFCRLVSGWNYKLQSKWVEKALELITLQVKWTNWEMEKFCLTFYWNSFRWSFFEEFSWMIRFSLRERKWRNKGWSTLSGCTFSSNLQKFVHVCINLFNLCTHLFFIFTPSWIFPSFIHF